MMVRDRYKVSRAKAISDRIYKIQILYFQEDLLDILLVKLRTLETMIDGRGDPNFTLAR